MTTFPTVSDRRCGGVCAVLLVKDEIDIVGWTLRHLATQVDALIVADNGSTDGTRELLADLDRDGLGVPLYVRDDPDPAYYQSQKMTALAAEARSLGYEWLLAGDADERWSADDGRPISAWLRSIPPDIGYVRARVFHYIPTARDPWESNPFARIGWRLAEPSSLPKVCARLVEGLEVDAGNHGVLVNGARVPLSGGGLRVDHYSWRSPEQFAKKIVNGARAYALTDLPEDVGPHWRMWGDPDADDLPDRAAAHFRQHFFAENPPCAPGSTDDRGLAYDPAVES